MGGNVLGHGSSVQVRGCHGHSIKLWILAPVFRIHNGVVFIIMQDCVRYKITTVLFAAMSLGSSTQVIAAGTRVAESIQMAPAVYSYLPARRWPCNVKSPHLKKTSSFLALVSRLPYSALKQWHHGEHKLGVGRGSTWIDHSCC